MSMNKKKYLPLAATMLFLLATWCYWLFACPAILVFKEQTQMFLFNTDYLVERLAYPAGVARYVAEFLVQFYNNLALGALLVALMVTATQWVLWLVVRKELKESSAIKSVGYGLTYMPALLLLSALGNENINHTFPVAILLTLVAIWLHSCLNKPLSRSISVAVLTPILYWAVGPVFLLFPLYVAVMELKRKNIVMPAIATLYAVAVICISIFTVDVPLSRIFLGITYTLVIDELMPMLVIPPVAFAVVLVIVPFLSRCFRNSKTVYILFFPISLAAVAVPFGVSEGRYDVLAYDHLVRSGQWDAIIHKAERKNPTSPLTVASLNLALAMKGQQNDRAGQFFQNGPQGAFPLFNKNFLFSLMTSEVYFNVGLVNTAQRLAFEAMETIPDNNKSARIMKRLAETNLINGQYEVAHKYLKLLKQTLFYSKWAERTEQLLYNEEAINEHPLYGHMRKVRLQNDFIFSEVEVDKIMGQLIMQNPENAVAQQYLLLMPLLEGNKQKYMTYRSFLQQAMSGELKRDTTVVDSTSAHVDVQTGVTQSVDGHTGATEHTVN